MAVMTPTDGTPPSLGSDVKDDLALVVGMLSDAVLLIDSAWCITYANPIARRISKLKDSNINHQTLWELYPGLRESSLGHAYYEVVRTQREHLQNGFYYEPFDTTYDVRILPLGNGVAVHYRDVSDILKARQASATAGERLQQVLDSTADGVISVAPDWTVTFVNRAAATMVAPSGEIVGRNLWQCFPDARYPGSPFVEHYERAMNDRIAGAFEAFYPDPLNIWVDVNVRPSGDGVTTFFRDITERKAQDHELRASEARYRVLTELSPQSLWTASPEGLVLYANQRFLTYIGFEFVPRTGTEYVACFDPADQARVVEVWTHSVLTGEDYDIDARLIRAADGASRWWHLRALPVRDADGKIDQWLGSAVDIHNERLVQQKLLDQMEQQRKAEAALIQSEKLAAVGRMASSIAHEINNPLESVTNLIYLARSYAVNPDAQQYLDMADQEIRRVSSIANQTLRFHKQASNPRAIDSRELFATVLSLYEGRLRNSRIEVDTTRLDGSPVACFEGDIRQVLNNLVGNAVDAMPKGGHLVLRGRDATDYRPSGPPRRGLRLTIADTGSGMSAETKARVFEAFFTTKGISGTGLGLWISAEIMHRHHGRLCLRSSQSADHHGTVFTLFLPCEASS